MTNEVCPACRGRREIDLPLMYDLEATASDLSTLPEMRPASERFKCPKCVPQAPYTHIGVHKGMSAFEEMKMRPNDKVNWTEYHTRLAAMKIVDKLLGSGMLKVEEIPGDGIHGAVLQVTLNAVDPLHTIPLERRVAERQMEVAEDVAKEAAKRIDNWGSYHGWSEIPKGEAYRQIADAVRWVKDKWAKR